MALGPALGFVDFLKTTLEDILVVFCVVVSYLPKKVFYLTRQIKIIQEIISSKKEAGYFSDLL